MDLLAVQGTLKSLLQHHSSKASILRHFSLVYDSTLTSVHDYWKNHRFDSTDFCWQSNVSNFNMLSRLIITFLPQSKGILLSWLQSVSAVILESRKIKSVTVSIFPLSVCLKFMDQVP